MAGFIAQMKQLVRSGATAANEDASQITIPAGTYRSVDTGYQQVLYGVLDVSGSMDVNGILIVDAEPT